MAQLTPLTTPQEVDSFLAQHPTAGIFKAGTCHKTMQGFSVLETFLRERDLPLGFIRVVDWRPASNHVASLTGITHQSPQFLLFKNGQSIFDVDNWDITQEALAPVFEAQVPALDAQAGSEASGVSTNVEPYKTLMRRYLSGDIGDAQFQDTYVTMFRDDASLRSEREFDLLSRLFGDPDAYHGGLHQLGAPQGRGDLKERVQQLVEHL